DGATDDERVRLVAWLQAQPGVTRASGSPASESVLVFYDPQVTGANALLDAITTSRAVDWPEVTPAPERGQWRLTTLNTAVLAATMSGLVPLPAVSAAVALTAIPSARRALR